MPKPASTIATPVKTTSTRIWMVRDSVSPATTSSIVLTSEIGCSGSAAWTICRIAGKRRLRRLRRVDHQVFGCVIGVVQILFGTQIYLGLAGSLQAARPDVPNHPDHFTIVKPRI